MGKSARRLIEMRCNSATVAQSMTELYNKILQ